MPTKAVCSLLCQQVSKSTNGKFNGLWTKIKRHCDWFIIAGFLVLLNETRQYQFNTANFILYFCACVSPGSASVSFPRHKIHSLPITLCIYTRKCVFTLYFTERNIDFAVEWTCLFILKHIFLHMIFKSGSSHLWVHKTFWLRQPQVLHDACGNYSAMRREERMLCWVRSLCVHNWPSSLTAGTVLVQTRALQ